MLPKEDLLKGIENREVLVKIIDRAEQAIKTWEVVPTDFLSPPEIMEAQRAFSRLTEVALVAWGGYPQAERQRLAIARSDLPLDTENVELAAINIAGNFLFDSATHRDFLGALLGTGLVREKVGGVPRRSSCPNWSNFCKIR
jgi:RNA-binding protein YlmH